MRVRNMSSVMTWIFIYMLMVSSSLAAKEGRGATSDKAVDGRYDVDNGSNYYLTVCAHPDTAWYGSVPAKWWVDLEDTYSISNVTVWNTYNKTDENNNTLITIVSVVLVIGLLVTVTIIGIIILHRRY
ncbi:hypothetical protein LSH36_1076g00029, partial [Paralvinella palmiformis]